MVCAERVRGELAAFRPSGRRVIWSPPASERVLAAPRLVAGEVWGPGHALSLGPGSGWELRCREPRPPASPAAAPGPYSSAGAAHAPSESQRDLGRRGSNGCNSDICPKRLKMVLPFSKSNSKSALVFWGLVWS